MAMVVFKSDNKAGECPGHFVKSGKQGVIVLQEWWGLTDFIKKEAEHISALGNFSAIVPDLYRGKVATDNETAGHYMGNLDWHGAVQDIRGAAKYLFSQGCNKVGVTGFCMGGALSLAAAVLVPEISASAPFYGIPSAELCDVTTIKIPLQCHFAEKDEVVGLSSPKDYEPFREKMIKANVKFEFYTYDAFHGFTNFDGPNYDKEVAEQSLNRMVTFMKEKLI